MPRMSPPLPGCGRGLPGLPVKAQMLSQADVHKITREEPEDARQVARDIAKTRQYDISMKLRKKVEMLYHGLVEHGSRIMRIESRQAYQALESLAGHKTDRNDVRGRA